MSVDYSQLVVIIPGWLTSEQVKLLFATPKEILEGKTLGGKIIE